MYRGSVVNGIQGDSAFRLNEAHTIRAGALASAEKTTVASVIAACCQLTPRPARKSMPDIPFPAIDTSVLLGWLGGVYVAGRMEAHATG